MRPRSPTLPLQLSLTGMVARLALSAQSTHSLNSARRRLRLTQCAQMTTKTLQKQSRKASKDETTEKAKLKKVPSPSLPLPSYPLPPPPNTP